MKKMIILGRCMCFYSNFTAWGIGADYPHCC